ncbi:hypothetical protein D3P08_19715 [Paenibacillus nanensis]|uniref:Uncharacterized protein n=1 Tax=Paenibacillus nanensis TaxID=393251 RepID=A0A3A1UQI0_9BACL|nr:hypothetical protein [Paenibacillus nanensis]RIX50515.1 hypothetical protein D3P08_19715 [Paenibacillus nanensis]
MNPLDAHVRGMVDRAGAACAEVEVRTDDAKAPVVLAYFTSVGSEPALKEVLRNDADTDIDWFDNNMHQAFKAITDDAASSPESDHSALQRFGDRVLAMEGVRERIRSLFQES